MKLVIVESPSKAKTIEKYLGKDYKVLASYGHIRQLPSKSGSINPENKFSIIWEDTAQGKKHLKEIAAAAKSANEIYLATDPDREGEAISWHINNYLNENKLLSRQSPVKRVIFNAITKENINEAFKNPRNIDDKLVAAYLARISLDYLVGFNISPILWHKLPGSKSAGRVQSVALRLICEREAAREDFIVEEYWQIEALLEQNNKLNKKVSSSAIAPNSVAVNNNSEQTSLIVTANTNEFKAKLTVFNKQKLEKLAIKTKAEATTIQNAVKNAKSYFIKEIIKKQISKNPYAPFTTSSMQQDSFNKLGFSAKKTMLLAQKLYEGVTIGKQTLGLITYMRTDAIDIVPSFIAEIRDYIKNSIGNNYLAKEVRKYKTKAKNAQEAHEAIRPTQITLPPEKVKSFLTEDEYKLYSLIWQRAIASQMASARYSNTSVIVNNEDSSIELKASGSILEFEGFYKVYGNIKENAENTLPLLTTGSSVTCKEVIPSQHFTEPPPRFTEATLVKTLEELGIGRPSTYASIISVLLNRKYAYIENKKFHPEERGRILNSFLTKFFTKYVDYDFTANMEEDLDKISRGDSSFFKVLDNFWQNFQAKVAEAKELSPAIIIEALNEALADKFIGKDKTCPTCKKGTLLIKYSKFGAFIACSLYPECKHIEKLHLPKASDAKNKEEQKEDTTPTQNKDQILSKNDQTGEQITLKYGPYGPYIERSKGKEKAKRTAIPKNINPKSITLEEAEFLLSLPKAFNDITLNIGRFGPYLKKDNQFFSLKNEDIFSLTIAKAQNIVTEQINKKAGTTLGVNPKTKESITLHKGRFGSYLTSGKQKVKLPKEYKDISLQDALAVINQTKK